MEVGCLVLSFRVIPTHDTVKSTKYVLYGNLSNGSMGAFHGRGYPFTFEGISKIVFVANMYKIWAFRGPKRSTLDSRMRWSIINCY